jgi:hypothetical protein
MHLNSKIRDAKIVCNVVKDLRGKIIVFTGPSSGLGYETVKHLAGMNGTIILGSFSLAPAMMQCVHMLIVCTCGCSMQV